jgi:hypothetical protein
MRLEIYQVLIFLPFSANKRKLAPLKAKKIPALEVERDYAYFYTNGYQSSSSTNGTAEQVDFKSSIRRFI